MAEDWRRIIATLADPVRRRVYASLVLDIDVELSAKKRDQAVASLLAAGLLTATPDGPVVDESAFTRLLAGSPVVARTGVDRFIREGRIEGYPSPPADCEELLRWARDRVLPDDLALDEPALNERLASITHDVASLRRYLVDAGLLVRDAAGREYRRASTPQQVP
jgi:hypothetical protein